MIRHLYTLGIYAYKIGHGLVAFTNSKAKKKIHGVQKIDYDQLASRSRPSIELVFIHCASQGEYEQARPVINRVLDETDYDIIVSFFSPSGFENINFDRQPRMRKTYLPFDTPGAISKFLNAIRPSMVIIVKNEWWWNLLDALKEMKVPTFLISATIRKHHYFIRYPFHFFKSRLQVFDAIFVIDKPSKENLSVIYKGDTIVAGDTRLDQTLANAQQARQDYNYNPRADSSEMTIVYGSVWESDLKVIKMMMVEFPTAVHLLYPHLLDKDHVGVFLSALPDSKLVAKTEEAKKGINIITSMGQLKFAYSRATFAYIGGGHGQGIHNVLEAAVYGIPITFGPRHRKSNEAMELIQQECAFVLKEDISSKKVLESLRDEEERKVIESKLKSYFSPSQSPTDIIFDRLFKKK